MQKTRATIAMLGLVALTLTGCSTASTHAPGSAYQLESLPSGLPEAHFSFPYLYDSVDQIAERTTDVVVATSVAKSEDAKKYGLEMTNFVMRVEQVLDGDLEAGQEIDVVYTGGIDSPKDGPLAPMLPSHPKDGLQYILMMWTAKTESGDLRAVVGPAQWVREFDDQRFTIDVHELALLTGDSTVPLDITVEEMKRELQRLGR